MRVHHLNTDRIAFLRDSWTTLQPQSASFTNVPYEELVSAEPQLRILFGGPMDYQHIKPAIAIAFVVNHIDDPSSQAFKWNFASSADDMKGKV